MTFSIRFKLACLFTLFGTLVTGLTGYYSYTASRDMLLNSAKRGEFDRGRLREAIERYRLDDPAAADAGNTEGSG